MARAVIGALRVTLGMDSAAFTKGLGRAQSRLSGFGKMASRGLLAVGAAATTAAAALGLAVRGTLNAADDMAKASRKIGIPIEELSRLRHAADLSGVSFGGLQNAVRRLSANMHDARNGTGEARDALEHLGISVSDVDGTLKTSSQLLTELSEKFAAMPDGAEKTALALDLMGRSGADMIPMLNGGARALEAMMAEADTLGLVFTEDMGQNAEAFNDNMTRLSRVFTGIANQLATELAPHLAAFTDWLVRNAPKIVDITVFVADFGATFVREISAISGSLQAGWSAFESWWTGLVNWGNRVKASLHDVASHVVEVFIGLPGQVMKIGEQIMQGLIDGISSRVTAVKDQVLSVGSDIGTWFRDALDIRSPSRVMAAIGQQVMQGLMGGMTGLRSDVLGIATSMTSSMAHAFTGIVTGAERVKDVLKTLLTQMANMALNRSLQGLFGNLAGSIGGGVLAGGPAMGFGGFFADGGYLGAGNWGVAGENGPEPILGPARVVSNRDAFAAQGDTIHVSMVVQSPDADSFKRSETQIAGRLVDAISRGQRGR